MFGITGATLCAGGIRAVLEAVILCPVPSKNLGTNSFVFQEVCGRTNHRLGNGGILSGI